MCHSKFSLFIGTSTFKQVTKIQEYVSILRMRLASQFILAKIYSFPQYYNRVYVK